jgi:hypothetical protein
MSSFSLYLSIFFDEVSSNDWPILFGDSYTILKNNGGINLQGHLKRNESMSDYTKKIKKQLDEYIEEQE